MKRSRVTRLVGFGIGALALNACGLSSVPEVPVAQQWSRTINNFSMIPIYPMRENVYVGDIRLTVDPTVVQDGILPYRNLGYLDLSTELAAYYRGRPAFPADENFEARTDPKKGWTQPTKENVFAQGGAENLQRLRMAALPGVKVATVAQGSVGARIPLGGWGQLGGGAAAQGSRVLDISLTGIEEIEAPTDYILRREFLNFCASNKEEEFASENLQFALDQLIPTDVISADVLSKARPQISIVSRVLYARSVDYTFKTDQGYGADLAAVVGPLKDLQALSSALGTEGQAPSGQPAEPTGEGVGTVGTEVAKLVAGLRSTLSASASPGVAFSAVFVDARGVTMRDVFIRPMAFAAQAIAFDASPSNFETLCTDPVGVPSAGNRPLNQVFDE